MGYILSFLIGEFFGLFITCCVSINKINTLYRKINNQKAMINNRDILIERQRKILSEIKTEINIQQLGSVENLQNKIKSILFNDRKSDK